MKDKAEKSYTLWSKWIWKPPLKNVPAGVCFEEHGISVEEPQASLKNVKIVLRRVPVINLI